MEGTVRRQKGFTLLEVLISVGVLFIIGSAVLSLSNTLIQGTVGTADATVTNLWAAEGLELVTKNRDDRTLASASEPWLAQANTPSEYGWYTVQLMSGQVTLTRVSLTGSQYKISKAQAFTAGEQLTSEALTASRLICIEAVGARSLHPTLTSDQLSCNLNEVGSGAYNDGARQIGTACRSGDVYCSMTVDSVNKNSNRTTFISAGSAVKVRSVLVWQNQYGYQTAQMGTLLTNWRNIGQ